MQIIDRVFNILEYVAASPRPRALGEIAAHAQLAPPTCAHIVKGLVARGYMVQTAPRKGYIAGPMVNWLGSLANYRQDLVDAALPLVRKLADSLGETVQLSVASGGRLYYLINVDGNRDFSYNGRQTMHPGLYSTAMGRVIIAGLRPRELDDFIGAHELPWPGWPEAASRDTLLPELQRIREQGFTVIEKGSTLGLAFPVIVRDRTEAALGLPLNRHSFFGERRQTILKMARQSANKIADAI